MTIDHNGNVGIGTTTPSSTLDVTGTGRVTGVFTGYSTRLGNYGGGHANIYPANNADLFFSNSAGTPLMMVDADSTGNVGIGTSDPDKAKLEVNGNVLLTDGSYNAGYFVGDTSNWGLSVSSGGSNYYTNIHFGGTGNNDRAIRFMDAGVERMRINGAGNVGIGTTAPGAKLTVDKGTVVGGGLLVQGTNDTRVTIGQGQPTSWSWANGWTTAGDFSLVEEGVSGSVIYVKPGGNVGVGTTAPGYKLHVVGQVAGNAAYVNTSDARLKKDVENLDYGLRTIMLLRPVSFQWNEQKEEWQKGRKLGLIAQEAEKVVPEVVSTAKDENGTKSIAYGDLTPIIIKAVHELNAANDNLKSENERLRGSLDELRGRVEKLEYVK